MKIVKIAAVLVGLIVVAFLGTIGFQVWSFGSAQDRAWAVDPLANIAASSDSAVLARGAHIGTSYGACVGCHGEGLSGQLVEDLGPIGMMYAPNLTTGQGGVGAEYTDAELARAIRHGIRRDGRSLLFMPTVEHFWWPDEDLQAVVSWVRSMPPVDNDVPPIEIGTLGKVLNGFGVFPMMSAEQVDHFGPRPEVRVAPDAAYGAFLIRSCVGCHGEGLSGGRIPGAPADLPTPANLTLHETGLGGWTADQFDVAMRTGTRPDGSVIADFMPRWDGLDEVEMEALWAYLQTVEPRELGGR